MNVMVDANDEKAAVEELCRLCANTDKQFIPIFQGEGIEHNIADQIQKYLPIITVTKADELPLQICYQCTSTLLAWHNFFEQCRVADCRLREISINVKINEDDGTYIDCSDDFRDDFEEEVMVTEEISDNTQEEIVLPELISGHSQVLGISDNSTISIDVDVSEPVSENLNENQSVAPASRAWVPFATKRPRSLLSKDERVEMWKPKKIRIDRATGQPVSATANLETAPESNVIFTPIVLYPKHMAPVSSIPAAERKSKVGKIKVISLPVESDPQLENPLYASFPVLASHLATAKSANAKTKETAVKVAATSRTAATSKTAAPKSSHKDHSGVKVQAKKNETDQQLAITCDDCEVTTKTMASMQRHYKSKHPEGLKDIYFACFHCCFITQRKGAIQRHILDIHMGDRRQKTTVTCGICWRDLSSKRSLRLHIQRCHNLDGDSAAKEALESAQDRWNYGFCCDICGRGYENESEMLAHRDVYHADSHPMSWASFLKNKGKIKACANCKSHYRMGHFFANHLCVVEEDTALFEERMKEALCAKPSFRCDICSFSSIWKLVLRQHWEKTHTDALPVNWDQLNPVRVHHYCVHCYKAFDEETELAQHFCAEMEMETKPKQFVCTICDISFPRKSTYLRHCQIKHGVYTEGEGNEENRPKPPIRCPYCEHVEASPRRALAHIKQAHNVDADSPFICVPCNKTFQRRRLLEAHDQIYHPKDEAISAENERMLAKNRIFVNGEVTYHCGECGRYYEQPMRFLTHYRSHFAERKFVCHLCGKQMRFRNHLRTHIRNFHLDIRNYECDICHKSFHSKLICDQHRRIHTGERPFACEVCGKTFQTSCALLAHKKFHDDFYPHECHLCPKKFKIKRCLTNHIRVHTGERPFKCDLCLKTFSDPSRFSYHKKITHSEERRVECKVCGNRYKAKKYLTRHTKKEHPDV